MTQNSLDISGRETTTGIHVLRLVRLSPERVYECRCKHCGSIWEAPQSWISGSALCLNTGCSITRERADNAKRWEAMKKPAASGARYFPESSAALDAVLKR